MSRIKELRVYLNFFKNNWLIIFLPTIILSTVTLFAVNRYFPKSYHKNFLLEMEYQPSNITLKSTITDEAIQAMRSQQIQKDLEISDGVRLNLLKIGPVLVLVDVSTSNNRLRLDPELEKVEAFAFKHFSFKQIGKRVEYESADNKNLLIIVGALISFALGITAALIKTYFKNY